MANLNEATPSTIITLANEVRDMAHNVLQRTGSIADCLGGSHPECSEQKAPEAIDLHSVLQRVVSILSATQDEIYRCENVIGLAPTPQAPKTATSGVTIRAGY